MGMTGGAAVPRGTGTGGGRPVTLMVTVLGLLAFVAAACTSAPGPSTASTVGSPGTAANSGLSSPQRFAADAAAFEAAVTKAQSAVGDLPSGATSQQVTHSTQPLVDAANAFQAQIVNLQWPTRAKPLTQSLTESVGQLTAVVMEAQRPAGFPSISAFRAALFTSAATVRSASNAVTDRLGHA